jgi:hypothetical protein
LRRVTVAILGNYFLMPHPGGHGQFFGQSFGHTHSVFFAVFFACFTVPAKANEVDKRVMAKIEKNIFFIL